MGDQEPSRAGLPVVSARREGDMGKVGKIVLGAVGIAVLVVPGLGPAITGAIYGGLAGGAVGAAAAAALTFGQVVSAGLALYGLSTALSLASSLFSGGAPKPPAVESQQRQPIPPRVYIGAGTRRIHGAVIMFDRTSGGSAVDVIAYIDGRAKSILHVYLNDDEVTISGGVVQALGDGAYGGGNVKAGYSLGLATETAHAAVVSALTAWTNDHRGDGVVTGYLIKAPVKSKEFIEIYPQGDNVALSLVIERWHPFDPRGVSDDWDDDDTWTGPVDNPVLGLLRYLVIDRGEDYATRIAPVISYWTDAADICDAARALKAGGSEAMYRAWLTYDSTARPSQVIAEFLKTFDGWMGEDDDGHILIYAGELYTPAVMVDGDSIIDYEVKNFVEDEDRVNEVICSYISDQHDYSTVEASSWRDDADITERGKIVSVPFEPQVPSHAQAQYLANRLAAKTNADYSGTCSTTYSGRAIIGHRYIELVIVEAGATFYSGWAEILTIERNTQTGGVIFTWAAVDQTLDDWTPASDEGDAAPTGSFVTVLPLTAPTISAASIVDGPRLSLDITAPDRSDLTWFVQWRNSGDTEWGDEEVFTDAPTGAAITIVTGVISPTADVEVRAAYSTGDGRRSPWSTVETVTVDDVIIDGQVPL